MIKFVILLCVIVIVTCAVPKTLITLSPELNALSLEGLHKCSTNKAEVTNYIQTYRDGKYTDDPKFKRLTYCLWDYLGIVKEDGRLIIEKAAEFFPNKDIITKILTDCDKDMGTVPVENSYKSLKCFQDTSIYAVSVTE